MGGKKQVSVAYLDSDYLHVRIEAIGRMSFPLANKVVVQNMPPTDGLGVNRTIFNGMMNFLLMLPHICLLKKHDILLFGGR